MQATMNSTNPHHRMDAGPESLLARLNQLSTRDDSRFGTFDEDGIVHFAGEFWTAQQRQGNRIHEISYRACFKPQLPEFFINRLTEPGDIVYDPFMGRGTTPVEAALQGRVPYGSDINPLSKALAEPRINPPSLKAAMKRLEQIPWSSFRRYEHRDLLAFYHPTTLAQIEGLRNWLAERESSDRMDQADRWIRMVAINRLTGHSPGFFSVYTMPPNQAVTVERQRLINQRRRQTPSLRDVPAIIAKKSKALLKDEAPQTRDCLLLTCESDKTFQIPPDSVTLTVTSPPFLKVVNYETDNWLRCWFLGVDSRQVAIASYSSLNSWQAFIARTLNELYRITRPGGHVAFEVGEVQKGTVKLEKNVVAAAADTGFKIECIIINQQNFTKTSNCWGIANNTSGTNSNRIVVLRKEP